MTSKPNARTGGQILVDALRIHGTDRLLRPRRAISLRLTPFMISATRLT